MGPVLLDTDRTRRDALWAGAIVLALTAVYVANRDFVVGNDSTGNVSLAVNLIEEGRVSFTPTGDPAHFRWRLAPPSNRVLEGILSGDTPIGGVPASTLWAQGRLTPVSGHYYVVRTVRSHPATGEPVFVNTFGPGAALAAVPVLAVARAFSGDLRQNPEVTWHAAKVAASILVAFSAAFLYLAARVWVSPAVALLVALGYGLGTCVWSVSSQALWQHPAAEFFLSLGALFLVRATGDRRRPWLAAGLALSCAAACRPPDVVFALSVLGWLAWTRSRALVAFLAGCAPPVAALAAYNTWFFGRPWSFGQTGAGAGVAIYKTGSPDLWQTPILTGLAGTLLSPSRGLLVYSPVLALGLAGAVLAWRSERFASLRPLALGGVLLIVLESKWFDWWGGWTYGYRRLVDLAPVLALLSVPALGWVLAARWRAVVASAMLAGSVGVQAVGAFAYAPQGWNARPGRDGEPLDIDQPRHRHRLWSWSDSQIPYQIEHFMAERRERGRLVRAWIDAWRPPPRR